MEKREHRQFHELREIIRTLVDSGDYSLQELIDDCHNFGEEYKNNTDKYVIYQQYEYITQKMRDKYIKE